MGIFSSPKANVPGPTKEERDLVREKTRLARAQLESLEEERANLEAEREREDVRATSAMDAVRRNLRGAVSLLGGGSYLGFEEELGTSSKLGAG